MVLFRLPFLSPITGIGASPDMEASVSLSPLVRVSSVRAPSVPRKHGMDTLAKGRYDLCFKPLSFLSHLLLQHDLACSDRQICLEKLKIVALDLGGSRWIGIQGVMRVCSEEQGERIGFLSRVLRGYQNPVLPIR